MSLPNQSPTMCTLSTEGVLYGCGHYISNRSTDKQDCKSKYCLWSSKHAANCPHCPGCSRFLGPDSREVIKIKKPEYCDSCQFWWKDNNAYQQNEEQSAHS